MKTHRSKGFRAAISTGVTLILLFAAGRLEARLVGPAEARTAVLSLLKMENASPELRLRPGRFHLADIKPLVHRNREIGYMARLEPRGFIILADITEVTPEVFISFSGDLEQLRLHPYFVRILDRLEYNKVRLNYLAAGVSGALDLNSGEKPDLVQMERNERAWSVLGSGGDARREHVAADVYANAVTPLLTTVWNQDAPFSNYTPRVNGEETPTGCSATATAQVMFYWKHPSRGQGSHSYQWNGQTLSADFNHAYDWARMLPDYGNGYTAEQADAVARLMSDAGISIDMDYAVDGSGAFPNNDKALVKFFKYSGDIRETTRAEAGSWVTYFGVIRAQIDVHQPSILCIYTATSGHAVVADGYRTTPSNQVHINMGWGGYADNYYSLDNIYGYGDAASDYAVVNIHPMQIKLTISATEGGTTNPAPGVYTYAFGTTRTVRVTALPNTHYRFNGWTENATGSLNPVDVVVNMEKKITANFQRIIYAPLSATGRKVFNRSFSQAEYINILAFSGHPDNVDIQGYRIYRIDEDRRTQITFFTGNSGDFEYIDRGILKDRPYTYEVVALNFDLREGEPAVIVIQ